MGSNAEAVNLWSEADHAQAYLDRGARLPFREEGTLQLIEHVPVSASRVLDLGTGDGRIMGLVRSARPGISGLAVDFSDTMLAAARDRFADDPAVTVVRYDLDEPLPADWGPFDTIVSAFAIHHVDDQRKRSLYGEIYDLLEPGGTFLNLEHVSSSSERLHLEFLAAMGTPPEHDDPSNKLASASSQLQWFRELGFIDVDCHWKWREMALLAGVKPL
jgi:SAM-dependent methyltransferase